MVKKTKSSQITRRRSPVAIALTAVLVAIVLANALATISLLLFRHAGGDAGVALMLTKAVDGTNRPMPLAPETGKAYVPELRLVFPASETIQPVYAYDAQGYDENTPTLNVANQTKINSTKSKLLSQLSSSSDDMFAVVPDLQACSRGVTITVDSPQSYGDPQGEKVLANGTKLYFYSEKRCFSQPLIDYVKQAESY